MPRVSTHVTKPRRPRGSLTGVGLYLHAADPSDGNLCPVEGRSLSWDRWRSGSYPLLVRGFRPQGGAIGWKLIAESCGTAAVALVSIGSGLVYHSGYWVGLFGYAFTGVTWCLVGLVAGWISTTRQHAA